MTRKLILGGRISLLALSVACGTSAAPDPAADAPVSNNDTAIGVPKAETANNSRQQELIPASLFDGKLGANDKVSFVVQTDTSALVRIERSEKAKASLQMAVERKRDEANLKRAMQAWAYHPDMKEKFAAGEEAFLTYTEEKSKKYYTVVFRAGHFFATLTNEIQNGMADSEGILFSAIEVKQLATEWGTHLKALQK